MFCNVQQSTVANKQQRVFTTKNNSVKKIENRPVRILSRRYPLTKTSYKYLDVGINVSTPSHVEIAVGDNHGIEIQFTYNMWKALLSQRDTIQKFFNNEDDVFASKIIGHVTLSFGKIYNDMKILSLKTPTLYLSMSSNTVYNLMAHEYCVDRIVQSLSNIIAVVDTKLARFREIASGAKDSVAAIRESESFDRNEIVDCELLAQIFAMR